MKYIIGCDECGYGSLAGPLVVCGVKASEDWNLEGLNDSKKLSAKKREKLSNELIQQAKTGMISYHIALRSASIIDEVGVAVALKDAYVEVFHALGQHEPISIIVDGILKFDNLGVDAYDIRNEIRADSKFPTVMAASILAKVYRDTLMHSLDKVHPEYGWVKNVGYGSKEHIAAIRKYGFTPLHRMSYKVKSLIDLYE